MTLQKQQQQQLETEPKSEQTQPTADEVTSRGAEAVEEAATGHEGLEVHVNPVLVVFGSKYWRTTVLVLVIWFTLIMIYFGLTLHLNNLGGNIYLTSAVAGSLESISICISILVVLKVGIRRSLLGYMLLPGISCLSINLLPQGEHNQTGVIALATIGKWGTEECFSQSKSVPSLFTAKCLIGANNAIIPTYTAMQYPTIVRNFGVGMGNLASGIALILVPFLWHLVSSAGRSRSPRSS